MVMSEDDVQYVFSHLPAGIEEVGHPYSSPWYVQKVRDTTHRNKEYVLKIFDFTEEVKDDIEETKAKDFEKKLKRSRKISHPNLVEILEEPEPGKDNPDGVGFINGKRRKTKTGEVQRFYTYILMEPADYSLKDFHDIPIEEALNATEQIADCLTYVYNSLDEEGNISRTVHRDVKPSNILVFEKGGKRIYKLCDFETMGREGTVTVIGGERVEKGTPGYLPPEFNIPEYANEKYPARDVYALGIVLYQMLTDTTNIDLQGLNNEFLEQIEGQDSNMTKCMDLQREPEKFFEYLRLESIDSRILREIVKKLLAFDMDYKENGKANPWHGRYQDTAELLTDLKIAGHYKTFDEIEELLSVSAEGQSEDLLTNLMGEKKKKKKKKNGASKCVYRRLIGLEEALEKAGLPTQKGQRSKLLDVFEKEVLDRKRREHTLEIYKSFRYYRKNNDDIKDYWEREEAARKFQNFIGILKGYNTILDCDESAALIGRLEGLIKQYNSDERIKALEAKQPSNEDEARELLAELNRVDNYIKYPHAAKPRIADKQNDEAGDEEDTISEENFLRAKQAFLSVKRRIADKRDEVNNTLEEIKDKCKQVRRDYLSPKSPKSVKPNAEEGTVKTGLDDAITNLKKLGHSGFYEVMATESEIRCIEDKLHKLFPNVPKKTDKGRDKTAEEYKQDKDKRDENNRDNREKMVSLFWSMLSKEGGPDRIKYEYPFALPPTNYTLFDRTVRENIEDFVERFEDLDSEDKRKEFIEKLKEKKIPEPERCLEAYVRFKRDTEDIVERFEDLESEDKRKEIIRRLKEKKIPEPERCLEAYVRFKRDLDFMKRHVSLLVNASLASAKSTYFKNCSIYHLAATKKAVSELDDSPVSQHPVIKARKDIYEAREKYRKSSTPRERRALAAKLLNSARKLKERGMQDAIDETEPEVYDLLHYIEEEKNTHQDISDKLGQFLENYDDSAENDLLLHMMRVRYFESCQDVQTTLAACHAATEGFKNEPWFVYKYAENFARLAPDDKEPYSLYFKDVKGKLLALKIKTYPSERPVEEDKEKMYTHFGDFFFDTATSINNFKEAEGYYESAGKEAEVKRARRCAEAAAAIKEKLKKKDLTPIPTPKRGWWSRFKSLFGICPEPEEAEDNQGEVEDEEVAETISCDIEEIHSDWGTIKEHYDALLKDLSEEDLSEDHPYIYQTRIGMCKWVKRFVGELEREKDDDLRVRVSLIDYITQLEVKKEEAPTDDERELIQTKITAAEGLRAAHERSYVFYERKTQPIIESLCAVFGGKDKLRKFLAKTKK